MAGRRRTLLCLSSYFKGNRFLHAARREGCRVFLLTLDALRQHPWARESLEELFVVPSFADLRKVIDGIAYLMRTVPIDCLIALDDYDVELVAALREHFRIPGMGQTTARHFRDKLAMRTKAQEAGIPVPRFTSLFHHEHVRRFLAEVPPPWLMKPRSEASSIGIKKLQDADAVWARLRELGDESSFHLLEEFIPSDVFHLDSLVTGGQVVFAEAGAYHRPLLEVYTGGGVFATRTLERDHPDLAALRDLEARMLRAFGMVRGCSHSEFLRARADGRLYFLETSARVGGACISDVVEAATGLNLWEEWARLEVAGEGEYELPPLRQEHAGATVSLARTERPDTSGFTDPEIVHRLDQKDHIGLVVRSPRPERVRELLDDYTARIARDHQAVLPPADRATA